jgi:hypothetical protein
MQHRGTHGHARPPPARAPPSVSLAFAQRVLHAPSRSPKALFSSSSSSEDGVEKKNKQELHPAIGKSLTTVRNKRQGVLRAAFTVAQLKTSKAWAGRGVTVVDDGDSAVAFALASSTSSPSVLPGSPLATELVLPLLADKSLLVTVAFSAERLCFVPAGVTLVPDEKKPSAAQLEAHLKRLPSLAAGPEKHDMLLFPAGAFPEFKSMVSSRSRLSCLFV